MKAIIFATKQREVSFIVEYCVYIMNIVFTTRR
jgi:hypothetical protein